MMPVPPVVMMTSASSACRADELARPCPGSSRHDAAADHLMAGGVEQFPRSRRRWRRFGRPRVADREDEAAHARRRVLAVVLDGHLGDYRGRGWPIRGSMI